MYFITEITETERTQFDKPDDLPFRLFELLLIIVEFEVS